MRGVIDYDPNDFGDWMAGDYWMHARGNPAAGTVSAVEVAAFVDGPVISGPADLPVSGTATRSGRASGLYAGRIGTDLPGVPPGRIKIGEYSGSFRAVADFSRDTISGSVTNIFVDTVAANLDGTVLSGAGSVPARFEFGATAIGSNATFTGTDVRIVDPRLPFTTNEGSWGGRFSTIDDPSGDP